MDTSGGVNEFITPEEKQVLIMNCPVGYYKLQICGRN